MWAHAAIVPLASSLCTPPVGLCPSLSHRDHGSVSRASPLSVGRSERGVVAARVVALGRNPLSRRRRHLSLNPPSRDVRPPAARPSLDFGTGCHQQTRAPLTAVPQIHRRQHTDSHARTLRCPSFAQQGGEETFRRSQSRGPLAVSGRGRSGVTLGAWGVARTPRDMHTKWDH